MFEDHTRALSSLLDDPKANICHHLLPAFVTREPLAVVEAVSNGVRAAQPDMKIADVEHSLVLHYTRLGGAGAAHEQVPAQHALRRRCCSG